MKRMKSVCVITHPFEKESVNNQVSGLVKVLLTISEQIILITSDYFSMNDKRLLKFELKGDDSIDDFILLRLYKYVSLNIAILNYMLGIINIIDNVYFFDLYIPALLVAKLSNKKIIVCVLGSPKKSSKMIYKDRLHGFGGVIYSSIVGSIYRIGLILADNIIVESKSFIEFDNMERYRKKICIAPIGFIDESNFFRSVPIGGRDLLVGYIGRFSPEKNLINIFKAIPDVLSAIPNVRFMFIGGLLDSATQKEMDKLKIKAHIEVIDWVMHDDLPRYLNKLKLLILPSYTEGLPNIILESMACGTPVLATSVGAIPDIIQDNQTGFILENATPECIASNIIHVLKHPFLEEITKNAELFISKNFTYESLTKRHKELCL